ncbi:MAG TPA: glycosyltransferase family 39 protein [candidate division Zixibacteria bacterium]|nr:glycosyltransferase family 39 protein [candidate division Zixibacteria bacterium]
MAVFVVIYASLVALHAMLLRLPYFWDEAGYFIPAARDLFLTGDPIAHTTLSNAHPPLVMAYLALVWKLTIYSPLVTRLAMLAMTSLGFTAIYLLARQLTNTAVAIATVTLSALYPVLFAQSSLAQLDVGALAFSSWALYLYVKDRLAASIVCSSLAIISKETAVVVPLTFFAGEVVSNLIAKWRPAIAEKWCLRPHKPLRTAFAQLLALVPLVCWYAYHFRRTGHIFGNPEYLRYNVGATITPLRIAVSLLMRAWHTFGYMNLFVLTGAALIALQLPARVDDGVERPRIDLRVQVVFVLLILAHIVEFSVLGGALLARYMIPVVPLAIMLCVATLWRRVQGWRWWTVACGAILVAALVSNPPWRIAPEDNLAYTDFVRLHQGAAEYCEHHYAGSTILTAWPASDELNRPFLGYVSRQLTVVHIENFTLSQMLAARSQADNFDVIVAFSTKYEPPRDLLWRWKWWRRLQEKYFDFHEDVPPDAIAQMFGGRIVWRARRGGEWVAIIELPRIKNAEFRFRNIPVGSSYLRARLAIFPPVTR